MWLGALFTSAAAAFGRLLAVHLLPSAVLAIWVWLILKANAFTSSEPLSFADLIPSGFEVNAGPVLLFILVVMLLAVITQPFQIKLVRFLEGYWTGSIGAAVAAVGKGWHRRLYRRFVRDGSVRVVEEPSSAELARLGLRQVDELRGFHYKHAD